jgi:hypothetical protein
MRIVLPLLLVAVAAAGCAQASPTATDASKPTTSSPVASSSADTSVPIDACKYLTQADAQSMLGVPTGPGKSEPVAEDDATCAYSAPDSKPLGQRIAITVWTGDPVSGVLSDFKQQYADTQPVEGLAHPAIRTADGAVLAMQGDSRGCMVLMSIKKPADPDAFAKRLGDVCAKAIAG